MPGEERRPSQRLGRRSLDFGGATGFARGEPLKNRTDKMKPQIRPIQFVRSFTRYAEGSVLVSMGNTQVLCNASISEDVPSFLKGKGKGWITAEYSMLPRSTAESSPRYAVKGKI